MPVSLTASRTVTPACPAALAGYRITVVNGTLTASQFHCLAMLLLRHRCCNDLQQCLCIRVALLHRATQPAKRFGLVLRDAASFGIDQPDTILGIDIPLLGSREQPGHDFRVSPQQYLDTDITHSL